MRPMNREFFYELTDRGTLLLDGVVQDDPWFLDFFFRRIAPSANSMYAEYPYVSRCGDEMNYVKPADTPVVFTRLNGEDLGYAAGLSVRFDPARLALSSEGVLYHESPIGEYGRIAPAVAIELAKHIEHWGPSYAFVDVHTNARIPLHDLHNTRYEIIRPRIDNQCIGCGDANPHSLRLSFLYDRGDERVRSWIVPDIRMQGALGTVHGGFISLLMDEAMGKCLSRKGLKAPTARLSVNFRIPVRIGASYELCAWIEEVHGRKCLLKATLHDTQSQTLVADADALFIVVLRDSHTP